MAALRRGYGGVAVRFFAALVAAAAATAGATAAAAAAGLAGDLGGAYTGVQQTRTLQHSFSSAPGGTANRGPFYFDSLPSSANLESPVPAAAAGVLSAAGPGPYGGAATAAAAADPAEAALAAIRGRRIIRTLLLQSAALVLGVLLMIRLSKGSSQDSSSPAAAARGDRRVPYRGSHSASADSSRGSKPSRRHGKDMKPRPLKLSASERVEERARIPLGLRTPRSATPGKFLSWFGGTGPAAAAAARPQAASVPSSSSRSNRRSAALKAGAASASSRN